MQVVDRKRSTLAVSKNALAEIHAQLVERIVSDERPLNYLLIDSASQTIQLCTQGRVLSRFLVSTGEAGMGSDNGSFKTPPGLHQISHIIGAGAVSGLLFRARIAQPLCVQIETSEKSTGEDAITSRILRLDGLEPGINRGENCDSLERYIYIHGTAEEGLLGRPVSHGCIRMANADVIELEQQVRERALVFIN